jgi:hypothetical protein
MFSKEKMTSNLKIIRVRDFVKATPQGTLNFTKAMQAMREASLVSDTFVNYDLLIDTRGSENSLSVTDIWYLAVELASLVHANTKGFRAKIPVLCPNKEFDHAKFFELCSQNRGLNVRAFTSFEDMFDWLSQPSEISSEL